VLTSEPWKVVTTHRQNVEPDDGLFFNIIYDLLKSETEDKVQSSTQPIYSTGSFRVPSGHFKLSRFY